MASSHIIIIIVAFSQVWPFHRSGPSKAMAMAGVCTSVLCEHKVFAKMTGPSSTLMSCSFDHLCLKVLDINETKMQMQLTSIKEPLLKQEFIREHMKCLVAVGLAAEE